MYNRTIFAPKTKGIKRSIRSYSEIVFASKNKLLQWCMLLSFQDMDAICYSISLIKTFNLSENAERIPFCRENIPLFAS